MKKHALALLVRIAPLTVLLAFGCAKGDQPKVSAAASQHADAKALPSTWVETPASAAVTSVNVEEPSEAAKQSVRATLKAHSDALHDVLEPVQGREATSIAPANHPKNWAPWHLDGMIAEFGFTVDGLFGALVGEGASALKVTWQKQKPDDDAKDAESKKNGKVKKTTLQVKANTSPAELNRQLEPTVRAAVAAGSVRDEKVLRSNLAKNALQFLSISRALSRLEPHNGWAIDGYQLQLQFDALGHVTPVISAGGSLVIVLNWARPEDGDDNDGPSGSSGLSGSSGSTTPPLRDREIRLLKGAQGLERAIGPVLSQDSPEKQELRKKGFVLDEIHVGMGISAGGDLGIAQADAVVFGKLNFKKVSESPVKEAEAVMGEEEGSVSMITGNNGALQNAIFVPDQQRQSDVFKVDPQKFGKGLQHALHIATFFANRAREVSTPTWKIVEIEAGFASSVSGEFHLVNVAGTVQVELAFHPPEDK